jgi:hypothetical protein
MKETTTMKHAEKNKLSRWVAAGMLVFGFSIPGLSLANHPVMVEGQIDFDGDGRFGTAEDNDGANGDPRGLLFGTITGCLGAMNGAIGQNGSCFIVTSGNFLETVNITNQVTIEAAEGVIANIEAFAVPADPRLQQFPMAAMDPFALQRAPGIVINSPNNRMVILRNLIVTNWTDGIRIQGASNVLLDNVRVDHNVNNGVVVMGTAKVAIRNSQITSTGFRLNGMTGDFPSTMNMPMPGNGISFTAGTQGMVRNSVVMGNFGGGIMNMGGMVTIAQGMVSDNLVFDNNRSMEIQTTGAAAAPAPGMMMAPGAAGAMAPGAMAPRPPAMAPGAMAPGAMAPGAMIPRPPAPAMAPGAMAPGAMAPGAMIPRPPAPAMAPGAMAPGAMAPGAMIPRPPAPATAPGAMAPGAMIPRPPAPPAGTGAPAPAPAPAG